MEDAKRFVAFVLEASGWLGPDAAAFLKYLRTLNRFPILRFCTLTNVISVSIRCDTFGAQFRVSGLCRFLRITFCCKFLK